MGFNPITTYLQQQFILQVEKICAWPYEKIFQLWKIINFYNQVNSRVRNTPYPLCYSIAKTKAGAACLARIGQQTNFFRSIKGRIKIPVFIEEGIICWAGAREPWISLLITGAAKLQTTFRSNFQGKIVWGDPKQPRRGSSFEVTTAPLGAGPWLPSHHFMHHKISMLCRH